MRVTKALRICVSETVLRIAALTAATLPTRNVRVVVAVPVRAATLIDICCVWPSPKFWNWMRTRWRIAGRPLTVVAAPDGRNDHIVLPPTVSPPAPVAPSSGVPFTSLLPSPCHWRLFGHALRVPVGGTDTLRSYTTGVTALHVLEVRTPPLTAVTEAVRKPAAAGHDAVRRAAKVT